MRIRRGYTATEVQKGRGNSLSRSRKRAGTINSTEETSSKRSKSPKCLACEIGGHTLPDCWYLFKCKRPKDFKAVGTRMKRVLTKVEHNKDPADLVAKIRLKQEDEA